jgi:hypothetical protein
MDKEVLHYDKIPNAVSGSGRTTRYWDCCKPSCAWSGQWLHATKMATVNQLLMRSPVVMVAVLTCVPIKFHELSTVHTPLVSQLRPLLVGQKLKPAAPAWS